MEFGRLLQRSYSLKMNSNVRIGLCVLCFVIPVVSNYTSDREFGFILGCITTAVMIFVTSKGGLLDKISDLLGWTEAREKPDEETCASRSEVWQNQDVHR